MASNQRDLFLTEMEQYRQAIKQTNSKYLKQDYRKKLNKMRLELREYDMYHKSAV